MRHRRVIRLRYYHSILDRNIIHVVSRYTLIWAAAKSWFASCLQFSWLVQLCLFFPLTFSSNSLELHQSHNRSPEMMEVEWFFLVKRMGLGRREFRLGWSLRNSKYPAIQTNIINWSCERSGWAQLISALALYKHAKMGKPTSDQTLSASVRGGDSIEFVEEWFSNKT